MPVAASACHGFFIEMKSEKGKVSEMQKEWIIELKLQGYRALVCYGWEEAANDITEYLKGR